VQESIPDVVWFPPGQLHPHCISCFNPLLSGVLQEKTFPIPASRLHPLEGAAVKWRQRSSPACGGDGAVSTVALCHHNKSCRVWLCAFREVFLPARCSVPFTFIHSCKSWICFFPASPPSSQIKHSSACYPSRWPCQGQPQPLVPICKAH